MEVNEDGTEIVVVSELDCLKGRGCHNCGPRCKFVDMSRSDLGHS